MVVYEEISSGAVFAANIRALVKLAARYRWLICAVTMLVFAFGTVYTAMRTPLYVASVRLQIERQGDQIIGSARSAPADPLPHGFLRTQFELLKSRSLAERVAVKLDLAHSTGFLVPNGWSVVRLLRTFPSSSAAHEPSAGQRQDAAGEIVARNVSVRPVAGSRLVDLTYKDPDPARAQLIANTYARAFINASIDKRLKSDGIAQTFLKERVEEHRRRLEASERALVQFSERAKLGATRDATSIAEANLAAANEALGRLALERVDAEQRWQQVRRSSHTDLAQFLDHEVIRDLRRQRKQLSKSYEEMRETFKPSYPAMRQIANKVREIDRQLTAEVAAIKSALRGAHDMAVAREGEMKARIEELRKRVLELQKSEVRYNILHRETETNRRVYDALLKRAKEIDVAGTAASSNVFIVDPARRPKLPSEPNVARAMALSLAFGLGLGFVLAWAHAKLDDRIHDSDDAEETTGLVMLGAVPLVKGDGRFGEELFDPRSLTLEAYRSIASALELSGSVGRPASITVTSTGPGEGKSATSFALACQFAGLGRQVLLVDGDVRMPSLHKRFGVDNSAGLTSFLDGQALPRDLIQPTPIDRLALLPSGPLPANAVNLLGNGRLHNLIAVESQHFDLIIVDAPPLLGLADAQLIADATAQTLFVCAAGDQRKGAVRRALRRLRLSRATLAGGVLTKLVVGRGDEYGYSYMARYARAQEG